MKLKLELCHVYGGDGIVRYEKVEKIKLGRRKTKTTTKEDIGIAVDRSTNELQKETVDEPINTFEMQDGKPVLRLGGVHGKFWGAMKGAGILLSQLGGEEFKSQSFVNKLMTMISVEPIYVPLQNGSEMKKMVIPQIMNTIGRAMIPQHFDVIEKCNATIDLVYPEIIHGKVLEMLKQVERMACLNKRRTQIKILNWKEILNGGE